MKRILIYADEKTLNGSKSACQQVIDTGRELGNIQVNGIHIEDGEISHDFSFEDLIELGEIRRKFNNPLWDRIRSLSSQYNSYI